MKAVLVVEDEKPIRQGISAMVRRGPVEVGRVLECRNGAEALRLLGEDEIDLVITDLRMPKMDGIELVRRMDDLPRHPLVVVVSGYDDFESVSGMLRMGVRDYLLKPVERERMYELLSRMETELEREHTEREMARSAALQVVRSAMLGHSPGEPALRAAAARLGDEALWNGYALACLCPEDHSPPRLAGVLPLGAADGQAVLLVGSGAGAAAGQLLAGDHCAGLSGRHRDPLSLRAAYREALEARRHAFLWGRTAQYAALSPVPEGASADAMIEQTVQLLGVGNAREAKRLLGELLFLAQNRSLPPAAFLDALGALRDALIAAYPVFPEVSRQLAAFADPLAFRSAYACYTALCGWMDSFCEAQLRTEENQNQRKIHLAVEYLQEHFADEIDMAVVSNHVSMNYSQFSTLFKRYTGSNFQNHLRALRIEEGKRLLRETDLSIRQISERAGFKNEKHFMKAFKQLLAVSPSDYRGNMRQGGPPA